MREYQTRGPDEYSDRPSILACETTMRMSQFPLYIFNELRANYNDPKWWRHRTEHYLLKNFHTYLYPRYRGGIRVMDLDWDNLLVLDACRADEFERVASLTEFDSYERATSLGSATYEWTQNNFADRAFGDTVYIASNANTSKFASDSFHELIEVWKTDFLQTLNTVPPEAVVRATLEAKEASPNKRIIAHFMQPHRPFVTEAEFHKVKQGLDVEIPEQRSLPWRFIEDHPEQYNRILTSYRDALALGLESAFELAHNLPGRTVITSDHGNMAGERGWPIPIRVYGHPERLRFSELVEVPWAVIENEPRPTIVDDGTTSVSESELDEINEQLRDLGYLDLRE